MALTTQDLERIRTELSATKKELQTEFSAIREEFSAELFAVKKELQTELSTVRQEFRAEFSVVRQEFRIELSITKKELQDSLDERIKNLPTRDEFFEWMSKLMGELQASREENTILNNRTSDHTNRIEMLEEIHPGGHHSTNPAA